MNHNLSALALCLLCFASVIRAESPATQPSQKDWPRQVVVTVGDVRTRIDGPKMWTLSGIDFQNEMMATQDSAYGTVVTIRNVGHLGTAHFLDVPGKPGEVEKENVKTLQFFVDDKPVTKFTPQMNLTGGSFRMLRTSSIRSIDLESSVLLRDGVLLETAHLRNTAPIDLQKAHPLMYAFTPAATVYVTGDDTGIQQRGTFKTEGATAAKVIRRITWVALFSPTTGKGSVCCLLQSPPGDECSFLLVDAPGVYRKFALYCLEDKIVPKGFDGDYRCAVGFFTATEKDWEQRAVERLREVKAAGGGQ